MFLRPLSLCKNSYRREVKFLTLTDKQHQEEKPRRTARSGERRFLEATFKDNNRDSIEISGGVLSLTSTSARTANISFSATVADCKIYDFRKVIMTR